MMKLIAGTGLVLLVAFVVGVYTGVWWLLVGPVAGVLLWSAVADWSTKHRWGWDRTGPIQARRGTTWTSRS